MSASSSANLTPERIEDALNAAGVGVWEMELPSRRFTCSARCKELFGLAAAEAVAFEHILAAAHSADRDSLEEAVNQALHPDSNGRFVIEHRVVLPNGQERWVRSTGLALFDEGRTRAVRFQGITRDITETRVPQRPATDFELLAETNPEILWIARPDGGVSYFNQRWTDYTGQPRLQAHEWGWESVIHPADLPRCLERWAAALRTGSLYEVEYRFRRHDGHYRWFLGRAVPQKDALGAVQQWFGTCTDIDGQKRVEEALRQREEELERAYEDLEAKVTFRTLALEEKVAEQQQRIAELERRGA